MCNLNLHLRQYFAPALSSSLQKIAILLWLRESFLSERLNNVLRVQETFANNINDINVRFQKAGHELRVSKIELDALIRKVSVLQAELTVAQMVINSLQVLIINRAMFPGKGNEKDN